MDDLSPPRLPCGTGYYRGQRQCEWCDKAFWWHPKWATRFCSNQCMGYGRMVGRSSPLPWAKCTECDADFLRYGRSSVCSVGCGATRDRRVNRDAARRYAVRRGTANELVRACACGARIGGTHRMGRPTERCDRCLAEQLRSARRRAKRRRRAIKRGAVAERYERFAIFERDGWRCQLCGKRVNRRAVVPHPKAAVLDHVVPLARGGDDTPANVQCAHFLCNSIKSDGVNGNGEQLRLVG